MRSLSTESCSARHAFCSTASCLSPWEQCRGSSFEFWHFARPNVRLCAPSKVCPMTLVTGVWTCFQRFIIRIGSKGHSSSDLLTRVLHVAAQDVLSWCERGVVKDGPVCFRIPKGGGARTPTSARARARTHTHTHAVCVTHCDSHTHTHTHIHACPHAHMHLSPGTKLIYKQFARRRRIHRHLFPKHICVHWHQQNANTATNQNAERGQTHLSDS